jgi:hypothetical protein
MLHAKRRLNGLWTAWDYYSGQDPKGLLCDQKRLPNMDFLQIQGFVLQKRPLGSEFAREAE